MEKHIIYRDSDSQLGSFTFCSTLTGTDLLDEIKSQGHPAEEIVAVLDVDETVTQEQISNFYNMENY